MIISNRIQSLALILKKVKIQPIVLPLTYTRSICGWRFNFHSQHKQKSCKRQSISHRIIYKHSDVNHAKAGIIPVDRMVEAIEKDLNQHFISFNVIKNSFIHHITQQHYNKNNQNELISVLSILTHYPCFPLDNTVMLAIYKLTCFNLHIKSVEQMNTLLHFILIAESQGSQSPIFHQFLRFYLILPLQQLKYKYQLDFKSMSFTQAISQFIGKLVHRGFLSRTPPYQRNLNVLSPRRTLLLLRKNASVQSTLMVKKLFYTIFLEIKQFYEDKMKENLYHPKKAILLSMFGNDFLQVLSQEIQKTQHESVHLRELYMKLYLTLPNSQEQSQDNKLAKELQSYKYKNVIYIQKLASKHIERMDHLKLDEISEKIDVVIEFVQEAHQNMKKLLEFTLIQLASLQLSLEQMLLIILWAKKSKIESHRCLALFGLLKDRINSFSMWHHYQLLAQVLKYIINAHSISSIVENYQNYALLSLSQLSSFLDIFQLKNTSEYSIAASNILKKVLSTDFQLIGGQEIINFVHIYAGCISLQGKDRENADALRVFAMRYIADHHKQFTLKELEEIVCQILKLPQQKSTNFDDQHGNYPNSVFQQISPYISKVNLLFSAQTRAKLTSDGRVKTVIEL